MTKLLRDKTAELNNSIILPTMIISCRHYSSSSYYGPLLALLQTPYGDLPPCETFRTHGRRFASYVRRFAPYVRRFAPYWDVSPPIETLRPLGKTSRPLGKTFRPLSKLRHFEPLCETFRPHSYRTFRTLGKSFRPRSHRTFRTLERFAPVLIGRFAPQRRRFAPLPKLRYLAPIYSSKNK